MAAKGIAVLKVDMEGIHLDPQEVLSPAIRPMEVVQALRQQAGLVALALALGQEILGPLARVETAA